MADGHTRHPKLARPLVREALFEVRFETTKPYGIVPGQLFQHLQGTFPNTRELPLAQMPVDIGPPHIVRHQFLSTNGERLFQIGKDVLSINHVAYVDYDTFSRDCDRVLSVAIEIGLLDTVDRLGLRYINKAPLDRAWDEMVSFRLCAPGVIEKTAKRYQCRWISMFEGIGELATNASWPVDEPEGGPVLVLDFDHYVEKPTVPENVHNWRHKAHENIYEAFCASLQPDYFAFLSHGGGT